MAETILKAIKRANLLLKRKKWGTHEPSDAAFFREQAYNDLGAKWAAVKLRQHRTVNGIFLNPAERWQVSIEMHKGKTLNLNDLQRRGVKVRPSVIEGQKAKILLINEKQVAQVLQGKDRQVVKLKHRDIERVARVIFGIESAPVERIEIEPEAVVWIGGARRRIAV